MATSVSSHMSIPLLMTQGSTVLRPSAQVTVPDCCGTSTPRMPDIKSRLGGDRGCVVSGMHWGGSVMTSASTIRRGGTGLLSTGSMRISSIDVDWGIPGVECWTEGTPGDVVAGICLRNRGGAPWPGDSFNIFSRCRWARLLARFCALILSALSGSSICRASHLLFCSACFSLGSRPCKLYLKRRGMIKLHVYLSWYCGDGGENLSHWFTVVCRLAICFVSNQRDRVLNVSSIHLQAILLVLTFGIIRLVVAVNPINILTSGLSNLIGLDLWNYQTSGSSKSDKYTRLRVLKGAWFWDAKWWHSTTGQQE
jgi:hypothetical protein